MRNPNELYPLAFTPIYKEKVWGGRGFEKLGRTLPGDATTGIGESWELADLATTSVSGGGGNAEYSVVANGPLQGKTIRALMQDYGDALLGQGVKPSDGGGFPLLIKFLDANENLSVQVHPSPAYAAAHPGAHLKSEAWYIIDHAPGAVIYKGLAPGTTPQMLRAALKANTDEAVVPLLNAIPVHKGDCHYLPSGTLHALGAGVLVAEVQTPSDTTYRVYDWGRTDRELHIEQAMACIDFQDPASTPQHYNAEQIIGFHTDRKASCEYFTIDEVVGDGPTKTSFLSKSLEIWIALEGSLAFLEQSATFHFTPGQTVLLPGGLGGANVCTKTSGRWLRVTVP